MNESLHTLILVCAIGISSVQAQFSLQLVKVPNQAQVIVQAKISGPNLTVTGGGACDFSGDLTQGIALNLVWPASSNVAQVYCRSVTVLVVIPTDITLVG